MKAVKVYGIFFVIAALMPTQVFAHALWTPGSITPPRSTERLANLKFGPCGGNNPVPLARGSKPKIFKPNEVIKVEWIETINHVGLFLISFLDANYNPLNPNPFKVTDSEIRIAGVDQPRSTTITIPANDCPECAIQLIQEMWPPGTTTRPTLVSGKRTYYYSCSDIRIESSSNAAPGEIKTPKRTNNTNNVVLSWVNPGEDLNIPRNVAYRILIVMDDKPINNAPTNGTQYKVNDTVNSATAKVVYDGNLETATITGLVNTNPLYFKIFTYDVSSNYSSGLSIAPVAANVPPVVNLILKQGNLVNPAEFDRTKGEIIAIASISNSIQADTFSYDWSNTSNVLVDTTMNKEDNEYRFDPLNIDAGNYDIKISATNPNSGLSSAEKVTTIKIVLAQENGTALPIDQTITTSAGCSLSTTAKFDPLLLLLTILSIIAIGFKVRRNQ